MQVLAADVNLGYHDWRNWTVESLNGQLVQDFNHFSQLLRNNQDENVVFENKNGYQMVINHETALASEEQILNQYRIPTAHSVGLFND